MAAAAAAPDDRWMTGSNGSNPQHDLDVLLAQHARELFALRRLERLSEAEERLLDHRLRKLDKQHELVARRLQTEYRRMHFGKPPGD
jgi:hypothetical protein